MAPPAGRFAGRPVTYGLAAGGALVLISGFRPWFAPADAAYGTSSAGWDAGPAGRLALVLGLLLTAGVLLPLIIRRVPVLSRAEDRMLGWAHRRHHDVRGWATARLARAPRGSDGADGFGGLAARVALRVADTPPARLTAAVAVAVAGAAVMAILIGWMTAPAMADPVLPAGGHPTMPGVARDGLFAGLAGTTVELVACVWALRRARAEG
ncbi:hypothetical protein BBK14_06660 [Parafrankia soli]|uniref:Uncharacterized protein n=1 Tax=Parafrankia soli TaxID=2599596 RepID=A0A1S1PNG8_9ACTN|nr:hypothetical protein [Parafrankia soli]OHV22455.1 hypothetical protein BBK14_06660 [Parafrankia soli]